jgi:hypothetical protein
MNKKQTDKEQSKLTIMRKQFYKARNAAAIHLEEKTKFDRMIEEYYGFHYSDLDMDVIIDSLDYGTHSGLSWMEFKRLMKVAESEKKERDR